MNMQRLLGLQLKVKCDRLQLLETLKGNLERHKKVVVEARVGYFREAKRVLEEKLRELEDGKLKTVQVSLTSPQDMSSVYKTVIHMLELHQEPQIELTSDEVRMFVEDKWDWTARFLASNSAYSDLAASILASGSDDEDN
jgi:hypothetical protein